jgi:hypothetical protein
MLQKDVNEHQSQCSAIVARCNDCTMVYQRADALTQHSDIICLRREFRNFQQESQRTIQQLTEQLRQAQSKMNFWDSIQFVQSFGFSVKMIKPQH